MQKRITHKDIERACEQYNKAQGLKYPEFGYIMWADIKGDGRNKRGLYVVINENGGVGKSDLRRYGDTMRDTARILDLAATATKSPGWCLIIRAIHERGLVQRAALHELNKRGLWLSHEQKIQAGLIKESV